jgi:hypothetical protein
MPLTLNFGLRARTRSFKVISARLAVKLHFGVSSSQAVISPFVMTMRLADTFSTRSAVK